MARQTPVSEIDRQIGLRLREFRIKHAGMSAVAFAQRIGIDSNRLATYEHGRTPLPYAVAESAGGMFNISQRWLAEGKKPVRYYIYISPPLCDQIPSRAVFSHVYEAFLKPHIEAHFAELRGLWNGSLPVEGLEVMREMNENSAGAPDAAFVLNLMFGILVKTFRRLPLDLYQPVYSDFIRFLTEFEKSNSKRIEEWKATPKKVARPNWASEIESSHLADTSAQANNDAVKSLWPALKKRLQAATAKSGSKSMLAKLLNVDPTQISQWLSDSKSAREPGGEYALQMLHWVEQDERQK